MEQKKLWKDKKVLITGVTGFLGAHLANCLLNNGAVVIGISRNNSSAEVSFLRRFDVYKNNKKFIFKNADVSDALEINQIFTSYKPDTVFHLAASAIVSDAVRMPSQTISSNIMGTLRVLEAARTNTSVRRVLMASSDKAYGDHAQDEVEPLPFKEGYALKGLDIYSCSKTSADLLSQAYAFQYKIPIGILRCCNIYGPGDINVTRLIPRTILRLMENRAPQIKLGHEKVLREYMYIDDVVEAYMFLGQNIEAYYGNNADQMPIRGQRTYGWPVFNVGSYSAEEAGKPKVCENIKSVANVIESLRIAFFGPIAEVIERAPEYIEIPDEYSDSSKLLDLGYRPSIGFEKGLVSTMEWYKSNSETLKKVLDLNSI